ncbi:hypothetical protein [Streptomyces sp. MBT53]|uniref:hypothetical protein n=1 Tax=Streptomyces sp. MBT53 TaxID=1488384 RepID=UPI001A60A995|nr:hypothetical protein [Streptomyces sp. MBT53]MBK6019394.1 hypothetical protein [Streptomyces sp. MBT53]
MTMLLANLFIVAEPRPAEIRRALADLLGLPEEAVDVGDRDQEDRNWAAPVLCTYCPLPPGDVTLSLDITVTDSATGGLTEADLALGIAARVGSSVLYPAESFPPSANWAAVPDGRTVRCSMESDETGYGADAALHPFHVYDVAAPVPDLPPYGPGSTVT